MTKSRKHFHSWKVKLKSVNVRHRLTPILTPFSTIIITGYVDLCRLIIQNSLEILGYVGL